MKNKPMQDKTVYKVATFYANDWDAYGCVKTFKTEAAARKERERRLRDGYRKAVHIWSVTTKLIQE